MSSESTVLDGNAAGGMLRQVFAHDMTTAIVTCAGCSNKGILAETAVYASPMGMVIRCPHCSDPLLRIAHTPTQLWVDMSGVRVMQLPEAAPIAAD